jgi:amicyanin
MNAKLSFLLIPLLLLAACASTPAAGPAATLPAAPADTLAAAPQSGQVQVTIAGFAFDPPDLTIKAGSTVTWTNQDSVTHNVTADDNSWGSPDLHQGDTFSHTFDTAGTYAYHCSIHPSMKATITVVP